MKTPWAMDFGDRRAFTLIEMVVVITIILMLTILIVPGVQRALENSRAAKCQSNLRQIAAAVLYYANDHNGKVPRLAPPNNENHWAFQHQQYERLGDYLSPFESYRCPSATYGNSGPTWPIYYCDENIDFCTDYKLNDYVKYINSTSLAFLDHSWVVVAADLDWVPDGFQPRHGDGEHYAFLAGHVLWLSRADSGGSDPYGNEEWYRWGIELPLQ